MTTPPDLNYVNFAIHDSEGRILRFGCCPDYDVPLQARPGQTVLPIGAASPIGCCVIDGVLTPQSALGGFDKTVIVADGADTAGMTLPDPCEVRIDGVAHTVTGGRLELASVKPGLWRVEIDHPHHLPFETRVTAR